MMISIIMPTYNRGYVIHRAIQSVVDQMYKEWELIVVDDGSSDNTSEIVRGFEDNRIRYIHYETNKGGNYARNLGLKESKGEYIAFLDSDNEWEKDHLLHRIELLNVGASPIISFGRMKMIIDGQDDSFFPKEEPERLGKRNSLLSILLYENVIDTNTVVLSRNCFGIEKGFDQSFSRFQDWDFFLGIIYESGNHILFDDRKSVIHHELPDSITKKPELYWINRLKLIAKYHSLIIELDEEEKVLEYLSGLIQSTGEYDLLRDVSKTIPDEDINGLITELITRAAVREHKTSMLTKRLLNCSHYNRGMFQKLKDAGVNSVAVYGYGFFGRWILDSLKETFIITAIIDRRNYDHFENGIHFINSVDQLEESEAIIIAMANEAEDIKRVIEAETEIKAYTLEELL